MAALVWAPVHAGQVELGAGLAQPGLNQTSQPWAVGTGLRLAYVHPLSSHWSFVASGSYSKFFNDTASSSTVKLDFSHPYADRRWQLFSLDLGAQIQFARSGRVVPYARGTVGMSFWDVEYLTGEPVHATTENGMPTDLAANEVVGRAGLGLAYKLSTPIAVSLELEGAYLTGLGADFSEATDQERSRGIAAVYLKLSYDFSAESGRVTIESAGSPTSSWAARDTDGDGILDSADLCPATPKEAAGRVDAQGCPLDLDSDGVADFRDSCLETGIGSPVDSLGCVPDADADGVGDHVDRCPGTPRGRPVDSAGCPEYAAITDTVVLRFDYLPNDTELNRAAQEQLLDIAPAILHHPEVRLQICGYTDSWGSEDGNLAISRERALKVFNFLVAQGVPAEQLQVVGRGESHFVAPNDTQSGRAHNRRIEIVPVR